MKMKPIRWAFFLGLLLLLSALGRAHAQPKELHVAAGTALSWLEVQDYGEERRSNFIPELVGYGYWPVLSERWFLRPGLRLGYAGLTQADAPQDLRFEERDVLWSAELGLLYDGVVIPSFTLGGGLLHRWIDVDAASSITVSESQFSRTETLGWGYAQVGLGIPFAQGTVVLEPFFRAQLTAYDERSYIRYGAELTIQLW